MKTCNIRSQIDREICPAKDVQKIPSTNDNGKMGEKDQPVEACLI
jgi:hypothetical protein